jgi:haloacetate dehalogenase
MATTQKATFGAIHGICEEYRAAATLDVQHEEEARGRRNIACPGLVLWSHTGAPSRFVSTKAFRRP